MPPHETTKMQANLLFRGEDIVFHWEYFFTAAIDAFSILSIHKVVTNRRDIACVRIVPDRVMSVRPMFCSHQGEDTK